MVAPACGLEHAQGERRRACAASMKRERVDQHGGGTAPGSIAASRSAAARRIRRGRELLHQRRRVGLSAGTDVLAITVCSAASSGTRTLSVTRHRRQRIGCRCHPMSHMNLVPNTSDCRRARQSASGRTWVHVGSEDTVKIVVGYIKRPEGAAALDAAIARRSCATASCVIIHSMRGGTRDEAAGRHLPGGARAGVERLASRASRPVRELIQGQSPAEDLCSRRTRRRADRHRPPQALAGRQARPRQQRAGHPVTARARSCGQGLNFNLTSRST